MAFGAGREFLATRVSYKLDLKGPSLTLQTACSTSLVAVAQACQNLLLYQADMALAGGVSITASLTPDCRRCVSASLRSPSATLAK